MSSFGRSVAAMLATLGALLAAERLLHPSRKPPQALAPVVSVVRDVTRNDPNEEDEEGLLAGYYEDLLNASRAATSRGGLVTERLGVEQGFRLALQMDETHERTDDFLLYRHKPLLDVVTANGDHVTTNR